jgi:hypothetical protein
LSQEVESIDTAGAKVMQCWKGESCATETAQTEPEVMLGTFNVHSTPVTILFDSGDSHTFISNIFVKMHSVPMLAMK